MAQKILGQSGTSLADAYDVQGSIVGVSELDADSVKTVHEMGGVMFSERLSATVNNLSITPTAQNTDFERTQVLGPQPSRLIGMVVTADEAGRILQAAVSISTIGAAVSDCPIWNWVENGIEEAIRLEISGTVFDQILMVPVGPPNLPVLVVGTDSEDPAPTITVRGTTSAFGAGNAALTVTLYFAFPRAEGLSSRGLPIPSW